MKLKSFGCSFVFGTDLADTAQTAMMAVPSRYTYPALIAAAKDLDYFCCARPGAGNFEILNRIISEINDKDTNLFVINWSWIDRFSYIDETTKERNYRFNPLNWQSIMPIDTDDVAQVYYKHLHTQLRDKIETLTCIKMAIDCLRNNNLNFIMTWTDSLIWETQWHCPPSVEWLQKEIKPWLSDFKSDSFLDWSRKHGFLISDTLHPLEDAHRAAADLILSYWGDYVRS